MSDEKNSKGWDTIGARYQAEKGWPKDDLHWGHRVPPESELRALGEIRGKRAIVLGCGGGQDLVALARLGATELLGVDASAVQLDHARALLEQEKVQARLLEQSMSDLSTVADDSFDLAVSVHALTYVEHADACLREVSRVLTKGGTFGMSVHHPIDAATSDSPPYGFNKSYFQVATDWAWRSLGGDVSPFTSYHRTIADWFTLIQQSNLIIDSLQEPRPTNHLLWAGPDYNEKLTQVPGTLIITAKKPK